MDAHELEKKTPEELKKLISELQQTLRDMRFKITTRQIAKVRDMRKIRLDLARAKTVQNHLYAIHHPK